MNQLLNNLTTFWWIRLPVYGKRISKNLGVSLLDGFYLSVWPNVSAWLSGVILLAGFFIGWLHPGFTRAFSESMLVLLLMTVIGVMSGHLGVMFLGGFIIGDFFFAQSDLFSRYAYDGIFNHLWKDRLPLIIEYALMSFLVVRVPQTTKTLVAQFKGVVNLGRWPSFGIAAVLHLAATLALVYLWAQVVPLLIRPIFVWRSGSPPVIAMVILQNRLWPILLVAGVASVGRMSLQGITAYMQPYRNRYSLAERKVVEQFQGGGLFDGLPELVTISFSALWGAFLLSGMYANFFDGLLVGSVIWIIQAARARLIPVPLGPWPRWVDRVPVVVRIAVVGIVIFFLSQWWLGLNVFSSTSFRPILFSTVSSFILFYLLSPIRPDLLPDPPPQQETPEEVTA